MPNSFFEYLLVMKYSMNLTIYLEHSIHDARLILGLRPVSERRRYKVTPSLIGWAQT